MNRPRSTPAGEHRPVLLDEVLAALDPQPGDVVVDGTLGFGGHAVELLQRVGPTGKLIGFDLDAGNLPEVERRLAAIGHPFYLRHGNSAGLAKVIGEECPDGCDLFLVDLGMSSMQVDDAGRGFSYMRDGPLDMRMDRTRGQTAAGLLNSLSREELAKAFRELGDEPDAEKIATAIVDSRTHEPIQNTKQLAKLIREAAPVKINVHPLPGQPKPWQQKVRPTARIFQALRILVNRELASLQESCWRVALLLETSAAARAIISFHSGEDRLVKTAFKEGAKRRPFMWLSATIRRGQASRNAASIRARARRNCVGRATSDPAGPRRTRPALRRPRPVGRVESSRPAIA